MLKGGGDLVHLDQVVNCLGRGFADRLHRSVQIGDDFTDRIGPRRQGFASPLRALDGSGPIRKTRCLRGERGSADQPVILYLI